LELTDKSKAEVVSIIAAGKAELKNEKQAMLREAREDIIEIAIAGSRKILAESVDEARARSMAKEVVEKMI